VAPALQRSLVMLARTVAGRQAVTPGHGRGGDPRALLALVALLALLAGPAPAAAASFVDTFTRPDSTALGPDWIESRGDLLIKSNELRNAALTRVVSLAVSPVRGADLTGQATFMSTNNSVGPVFGVVLRYQDPRTYYLLYRIAGGKSQFRISRVVGGQETIVKSVSTPNPKLNVAFTLTGRVQGSTLTLLVNGAVKLTAVDGALPGGAVGVALGSVGNGAASQRSDNFSAESAETLDATTTARLTALGFAVTLGPVESLMTRGDYGIQGGAPDGFMSAESSQPGVRVYFQCWDGTTQYSCASEASTVDGFDDLSGLDTTAAGTFQPVMDGRVPGDPYQDKYAALNSTWTAPDGVVHGWYHAEVYVNRTTCPYTHYGSIGHATSVDGGRTFVKHGPVVTSPYPRVPDAPTCNAQGVGLPRVIEWGDELYLFADLDHPYPDGTNSGTILARASKSDPGLWTKYYNGGFTEPGLGGQATLIVPHAGGRMNWAGSPIWNSYLGRFVMAHTEYNAEGTIFIRTSTDLVTWSAPEVWFASPATETYRYPSQFGPFGDEAMGETGWIYFSRQPVTQIGTGATLARRAITFDRLP
jgi:hypothetical protein